MLGWLLNLGFAGSGAAATANITRDTIFLTKESKNIQLSKETKQLYLTKENKNIELS